MSVRFFSTSAEQVKACPLHALVASHYNDDGTCKCRPCVAADCTVKVAEFVITDAAGDNYETCATHMPEFVTQFTRANRPITVRRSKR